MGVGQETSRELSVVCRTDVFGIQSVTLGFAVSLGFERLAAKELAIVASELASNVLKYGVRGSIHLQAIVDPVHGKGIGITAFDEGPPFRSFELALRDGYSDEGPVDPASVLRRGGIGSGLGAVKRLSDEVDWAPMDRGKRVFAKRFLVRPRSVQLP